MSVAVLAALAAVVAVVMFSLDRIASHRNIERRKELKDWETWDTPEQARKVRNMLLDHGDEISRLRRNFLLAFLALALGGAWMVSVMQDTSDQAVAVGVQAKALADQTCQSATSLLRLQSADLTNQIRQRQVRRDSAADEIIELQRAATTRPDQPALSSFPGFDDLPASVRNYVTGLAEAGAAQAVAQDRTNISDAQRRLSVYDEDLARLRDQVDGIRDLTVQIDATCPDIV